MSDDLDFIDLVVTADTKIVNIESVRSKNNVELQADGNFFTAKFYTDDMWDTKEYDKLVKGVERQVRSSEEYSNYIGYLKGEIGLTKCAFFGEVTQDMAAVEMHHYPFTLYDIVNIVCAHKILNREPVTSFLVAHEVMMLHYENMIGVVPLSVTPHELAHAGELFINLNQVFGDVNEFVRRYSMGLTDDYIDSLNKLVDLTAINAPVDEGGVLNRGRKSWNLQGNRRLESEDV